MNNCKNCGRDSVTCMCSTDEESYTSKTRPTYEQQKEDYYRSQKLKTYTGEPLSDINDIIFKFAEFCSKYTFKYADKKWYKKFPFTNFPHYYTTLELYELFRQGNSETVA